MSLSPGSRLGAYEISAKIGEGGMGEVYQARDTKLDRDVALKVLPESLTSDPDRLARFEREAKVLASLNHPNIGGIYGIEDAGPTPALVLELVEGPTLAERVKDGPISIDEALPIATQIAEALEAAHEHGVIHRDLKPANVKVRTDGTVKVLDFGLAKAVSPDASDLDMAASPTVSLTVAATQLGMVIGTAAYMAPEQARGKVVDRRADVWAFGAVLFEMLTGTRPFAGSDVSETLAFVITKEIDWTALPSSTPGTLRHLLQRCLERDPRRRLRDIGEARIALEDPQTALATGTPAIRDAPRLSVWQRPMPAAAIGVALLAAGGIAAGMLGPWRTPLGPPPVQRVSISIPGAATYAARAGGGLAVAPDGSRLVYVALTEDGTRQLYLRGIDRLDPVAMPGTEGAWNPFFSPNGEWIGFFTDPVTGRGLLKKVAVAGGPPQTLCAAEIPTGSWSGDDQIVFAEFVGEGVASLFRVSAAGGTPEPVTTLEPDVNEQHVWPDVLPGDRAAVYSVYVNGASRVDLVSFETGETRTLLDSGVNPRYIESGHIVFMQDSTLMAVPFDLDDLDVTGVPAPVVEGVLTGTSIGGEASVAVSDSGLLVYARGSSAAIVTGPEARRLVWVDRQGQEQPLPTPERFFRYPRVSPDGQRVAVVVGTGNAESANVDLWVYDVETGAGLRLTYEGVNRLPIWTSDGQYVVFSSTMDAPPPDGLTGGWWGNVYRVPADGSGPPERLTTSDDSQALTAVTPDGQTMLYTKIIDNPGRWDITRVSARSDDAPEPVVSGPFQQGSGALSPDGRWLAYRSDETGQFEVYVQPYPGPGPKTPVSVGGGRGTVWAQDGSELFFRVQNRVVAVEVEHEPTFSAGAARTVLDGPYIAADSADGRQYHVAPDGRFLMLKPANISDDAGVPDQFVAVLNWFEELTERVPTR